MSAVAALVNCTQQTWGGEKEVAGALFIDVKSAFNNVRKAHLGKTSGGTRNAASCQTAR